MLLRLITCWQAYILIAILVLSTGHVDGALFPFAFAIIAKVFRDIFLVDFDKSELCAAETGLINDLENGCEAPNSIQPFNELGYSVHAPSDGTFHYHPTSNANFPTS
ncbi:hypothetical protein ACQU0X_26490 [Pseudovibrio ascidiaceicola]|uniref:hypothetical protein n=1 Tax=Pseudovibrio ascidiaceicola TaxID=285279 RepID=UPI000AABFAE4